MHHALKTVTVYHKGWDKVHGVDTYTGTVIPGVSFFSRINTAVSTDGLASACEATLRIPADRIPEGFALANGDLICEGSLLPTVAAVADLNDLCPYVFTVIGITRNTAGRGAHMKVVCK